MSYKSLNDVESVISLGKPIEVVDMFLESYKQGIAYELWAEGKDLDETITMVIGQDEDGNDITEEHLVNVYEAVDVSLSVVQWKKDNYAMLRENEYPSWKEFADAYVKDDVVGMDAYKAKCIAVKVKYPK